MDHYFLIICAFVFVYYIHLMTRLSCCHLHPCLVSFSCSMVHACNIWPFVATSVGVVPMIVCLLLSTCTLQVFTMSLFEIWQQNLHYGILLGSHHLDARVILQYSLVELLFVPDYVGQHYCLPMLKGHVMTIFILLLSRSLLLNLLVTKTQLRGYTWEDFSGKPANAIEILVIVFILVNST